MSEGKEKIYETIKYVHTHIYASLHSTRAFCIALIIMKECDEKIFKFFIHFFFILH